MSEVPAEEIKYGLAGVVTDTTAVSKVMQETNSLTYRGYAVQDLCKKADFMQTAYLLWHGELPNKAQLAELVEHHVQRFGLCRAAREAVENEPVRAIRLLDAVGDDADNDLVRYQIAAIHDFLGLKAHIGTCGNSSPQHLAGRQLDDVVAFNKTLALRPLARTRRSEKNDDHVFRPRSFDFLINPSYWCASRCD